MFNNILDVCGNKRIKRIRDLSLEEGAMWKQSWITWDCHIPSAVSRKMGKASMSSSSAASIGYKAPQFCPNLLGHEMLPWKCLKGISKVPEKQKAPSVLPGVCLLRDPRVGRGGMQPPNPFCLCQLRAPDQGPLISN